MIIVRDNIFERFTKIDKNVFTSNLISDGACRLYGYLSGLPTGHNYSDNYIVKALGISKRTLSNRKAELTKRDLILVKQIGPRNYMLFVGRLDRPASQVQYEWEKNNDK